MSNAQCLQTLVILATLFQGSVVRADTSEEPPRMTQIEISVAGQTLNATLNDSPAAQDFKALLPLTLELEDYHGIEKIGDLPKKLRRDQSPEGVAASSGDITYYAPWGNLAIFYRDFKYAPGLVPLGKIHADISVLRDKGPLTATFSLAE